MNEYVFNIELDSVGERIDKFLSNKLDNVTRSGLVNLIENKNILVNNKDVAKNYKLRNKDVITVTIPDPVEYEVVAENIPLDIVYEDDDLLVVNKMFILQQVITLRH